MHTENTNKIQSLRMGLLTAFLTLGLLMACDTGPDEDGASTEGMARIASQLHQQGDDEGAMEFYSRALQRVPNDIPAHKGLAEILEAHGDNTNAAEQYRVLTTLEPDNADVWRGYGRMLIKLNRPADAKGPYETALKINSDDVRTLNGLGITLDLLGDHAGAQEHYKAALEQQSDNMITLSNLGRSYVLAGSYDQAIKLLEPQMQNPQAPVVLRQNLAEAYSRASMDVDAERVLKMDLPPDQVKKAIVSYHAHRPKGTAAPLYANLGSFSTGDLAQAHLDKIKQQFAAQTAKLNLTVVTEVDEEGGTPNFGAHVSGFANPAAAKVFCSKLKKGGAFCQPHNEADSPSP